MRKFGLVMLVPLAMFAQELVGEFSLDTNVYNFDIGFIITGFRGPQKISMPSVNERIYSFQKKGTNQIDIFSVIFEKIGSITIPENPAGCYISQIHFNQTFLDNDAGWEYLILYYDTTTAPDYKASFKVIDETGATIIADSGVGYLGIDDQNTYVFADNLTSYKIKVWKFRTNIASASGPLSKSASSPGPMMTFMSSGDFKVSLQPVNGGTSVQIFDMLGRQVFRKNVQNINKPMSFTIPSGDMPNSPFVIRVQNNNGSYVKKEIPVR
jgi:hypothetical protein